MQILKWKTTASPFFWIVGTRFGRDLNTKYGNYNVDECICKLVIKL